MTMTMTSTTRATTAAATTPWKQKQKQNKTKQQQQQHITVTRFGKWKLFPLLVDQWLIFRLLQNSLQTHSLFTLETQNSPDPKTWSEELDTPSSNVQNINKCK